MYPRQLCEVTIPKYNWALAENKIKWNFFCRQPRWYLALPFMNSWESHKYEQGIRNMLCQKSIPSQKLTISLWRLVCFCWAAYLLRILLSKLSTRNASDTILGSSIVAECFYIPKLYHDLVSSFDKHESNLPWFMVAQPQLCRKMKNEDLHGYGRCR